MKQYIKFLLLLGLGVVMFSSCESLVDGINDNPNDILIEDVQPELFLTGTMLANTVAQGGHLNRIAGMYSGQLVGINSLYSNIYGQDLSTVESNGAWSRIYVGMIPNLRHIRSVAPDDALLQGITKTLEAHGIGTAASLFGDVPYSQVNDSEVEDPVFDGQASVFNAAISLLDNAIMDLARASSRPLSADIYFEGDATKWMQAANTLKARYYLQLKDYGNALTAAQAGISSADGSMRYIPRGVSTNSEGDKNLFWEILEGSRAGDIGTANSYMIQIIDPSSGLSRANAKTDETARFGYYSIDESGGVANLGIIEQFEPQNLVSFAENQLILAECAARANGLDAGLTHLNALRQWMNTGGLVNSNFSGEMFLYADYAAEDFAMGGMENADNIDPDRAFLREVIEERYISGFGMFMAFNDARRLRASDGDIAVPFFLEGQSSAQDVGRLPYSADELNSNANSPENDPGIFAVTPVNQ